ncbi:MAG: S8 family serine peptidase [Lentimicrobium sp.]|nr:S8 family serine peptidase [Lentimicrobium sp.]
MKNRIFTILLSTMFIFLLNGSKVLKAQQYYHGIFWIMFQNENIQKVNSTETTNQTINAIFKKYGVKSISQVFPDAKKAENKRIYEIEFTGDDLAFIDEIQSKAYDLTFKPYRYSEPILTYNPSDDFWDDGTDNMWHLKKIMADYAWDIQRGNEEIIIAVIDKYFDPTHPDLRTEFIMDSNPKTGEIYEPCLSANHLNSYWHGTTVAGFASGQTTEENVIAPDSAKYCSIGFNTKMLGYSTARKASPILYYAQHASSVMGADVITMSIFDNCKPQSPEIEASIISEILDNGTSIVIAAGNGFCAGCYESDIYNGILGDCDYIPADFIGFSPLYPFSPDYDERIIVVSRTNKGDSLTRMNYNSITQQWEESTFSFFPHVDVCAPGYDLAGINPTKHYVDSLNPCVNKEWVFWDGYGGTSFATPIVAGLIGLVKSSNPFLTPAQVQNIIKGNVDPVSDADDYELPGGISQTGTGRINAYKAIMAADSIVKNYNICNSSEVVWENTVYVKDYIRICSGSTLRVKSDVFFMENAGVVVDRGGLLIVDGGRLTGKIRSRWQGVLAMSKSTLTQNPINQSKVVLQNGGIIENARVGIATVQPLPDYGSGEPGVLIEGRGGAIIIGNNGFFKNNLIAVDYKPYSFYNISSFNKCSFINEIPEADGIYVPNYFVKMNNVNGIQFKGCDFGYYGTGKSQGFGIYSYNSSFIVDYYCQSTVYPCTDYITSEFNRLKYGIYTLGSATARTARIENCEFRNNISGIYASGILGLRVANNVFIPQDVESNNINNSILGGLYLDGCTTYTIEENSFISTTTLGQSGIKVGMVINNSGSDNNYINRNSFTGLDYGAHAQNKNRSTNGLTGLQFRCNVFSNCKSDISVKATVTNQGIRTSQGQPGNNPTDPAGNLFSNLTTPGYWSINNEASSINYYKNINQIPGPNYHDPLITYNVTKYSNSSPFSSSTCPSSAGGDETKEQLSAVITDNGMAADTISDQLSILVDIGDTEELLGTVYYSVPEEAGLLYNELLSGSPYLSDTVVHQAVEREEVLNNAMIRDVMVANPHTAKSEIILTGLDSRANPMPDYMYNEILAVADTVSAKELLEAKLSAKLSSMDAAFKSLTALYNEESASFDTLIAMTESIPILQAKYLKSLYLLEKNESAQAYNAATLIPTLVSIDGRESEYQDFVLYLQLILQYNDQDSIPTEYLEPLNYGSNELLKAFARNTLIDKGIISYQEPYLLPDGTKSSRIRRIDIPKIQLQSGKSSFLKVFPNPASYFITIDYQLPNTEAAGIITIFDLNGKVIISKLLLKNTNQFILSLEGIVSGTYLIKLSDSKGYIDSIKFTIQ